MIDLTIHFPSVMLGLVLGISATMLTLYSQDKSTQTGKLISSTLALIYFLIWIYWHLQAAQGNWLAVPQIFDALGGLSGGIMMGIDGALLIEKGAEAFSKVTRKK